MLLKPRLMSAQMLAVLLLGCGACSSTPVPDASDPASSGSGGSEVAGRTAPHAGSGGKAAGSAGQAHAADGGVAAGASGKAGASGSSAGRPAVLPECVVKLSESGCEASYDAAIKAIDCSNGRTWSRSTCGARRTVSVSQIDVGTTCDYDSAGKLIASSTCSKPIGNCNCFVGGEPSAGPCREPQIDACVEDAGSP